MKAYFKCICTTEQRLLANKLRREGYEVINLSKQRELRHEAKAYGVKLPFKVVDGVASEL